MASTTTMSPYRGHDSSVSVYQVPEFVVGGEKMLYHALYGNEAYEKLRKSCLRFFDRFSFRIPIACVMILQV